MQKFNAGLRPIPSLYFGRGEQLIPSKKVKNGYPRLAITIHIKIIAPINKTKQPDDVGQSTTYCSCDMLQIAPPSQI